MFGIFYLGYMSIGILIQNIRDSIDESNRKYKAYDYYDQTYYDKKGKRIYIPNGRWVHTETRNGDRVLSDVLNGKIYRNFSEEQRKISNKKNKEISDGTTYIYKNKTNEYELKDKCTDIVLIEERHNVFGKPCCFYIDKNSGKIIRKSDNQIKRDNIIINKISNEEIKNKIKRQVINENRNNNLSEKEIKIKTKIKLDMFYKQYLNQLVTPKEEKLYIYKYNNKIDN